MSTATPDHRTLMQDALQKIKGLQARLAATEEQQKEPIAVIGMGCRFPGGVTTPEQFWELLRQGGDAVAEVPAERWSSASVYSSEPSTPGKTPIRHGAFLDQVDRFDPQFFGISPREATLLDPQQRLLLETSWEALERACLVPASLRESATGVFVAVSGSDYGQLIGQAGIQDGLFAATGSDDSVAAGRLSYVLGFNGPCLSLDTACSGSLVAVHLACQSLRQRECSLALAGGVGIILRPDMTIAFSQAGMLASDGRCKAFDATADGFVRGEGCGMVVLKRLADALADHDPILALLRGSAVNHDGPSSGLTAPRGPAQQSVIRQALQQARIKPAQVSYIEAHGTGTALGDPIELGALGAVFDGRAAAAPELSGPLWVGSVKANIGHLEAAAGIAGLIKVVLMLQHRQIPLLRHFHTPTPSVDWSALPVRIPTTLMTWESPERIAGVSSFGYSGTNAHVVVSEAPAPAAFSVPEAPRRTGHLMVLSGTSAAALAAQAAQLHAWLGRTPGTDLASLCFTASVGRTHFPHRLARFASTVEELGLQLTQIAGGGHTPGMALGQAANVGAGRLAFLFSGQGSQYVDMGRSLYAVQTTFRAALDRCDAVLTPLLNRSILSILFAADEASGSQLHQTAYTQPALFAVEYALAQLWHSFGVEPDFVLGHSVGEYVAACLAEVFSLEDALKLVAARGRLMQSLPADGAMVGVMATESQVEAVIAPHRGELAIAAVNGPEQLVISGRQSAIAAAVTQLTGLGIKTRPLVVSHAFHSPLMEPILAEFEQVARTIRFQPPRRKLVSNLTGGLAGDAMTDPAYWVQHVCRPVRFADGVAHLGRQGVTQFLEIGPRPILVGLAQEALGATRLERAPCYLASLRPQQDDWRCILESLGALYVRGADIDWRAVFREVHSQKVAMPTYPFQRQRYWLPTAADRSNKVAPSQASAAPTPPPAAVREDQVAEIRDLMARLLHVEPQQVGLDVPFIEMGSDSVIVMDAIRVLEKTYRLKLSARQVFENLNTVTALAGYIRENAEPVRAQAPAPPPASSGAPRAGAPLPAARSPESLERIFQEQLRMAAETTQRVVAEQLAFLRGSIRGSIEVPTLPRASVPLAPPSARARAPEPAQRLDPVTRKPLAALHARTALSPLQQQHIERLTHELTSKTRTSKAQVQAHRSVLADSRASVGFRPSLKEMLYPLVMERCKGARAFDIDGNEYIDFMMGFGVSLFGHWPDFVTERVAPRLGDSAALGLRSELAGEVAQLFTAITGHERVCFAATGTEAVMGAIRMARAATGRTRLVLFDGCYHGHSDGTALAAFGSGSDRTVAPIAPGIPSNLSVDVLLLDYDNAASLAAIRAHAHELAGVLVEPVQSRRPDVQPAEFLRGLRAVATELDIPLIFDEMITGFRLHPQGAQGFFGVQADIATYGKILGGGFPIGAVAGKARYLDGVDGGAWQYGDASYPPVERVFFGGTFFQHPYSMSAALAVLERIQAEGPQLQARLNERTAAFVARINALLTSEGVPMKAVHCGSLFRFQFTGNLEVLFYHLLNKQVLVGEWRNGFLSTEHTDADLERTLTALKETIDEMRAGGFLR